MSEIVKMRYIQEFVLLLSVAFICYSSFVKMHVAVMNGNFETELGHFETSEGDLNFANLFIFSH